MACGHKTKTNSSWAHKWLSSSELCSSVCYAKILTWKWDAFTESYILCLSSAKCFFPVISLTPMELKFFYNGPHKFPIWHIMSLRRPHATVDQITYTKTWNYTWNTFAVKGGPNSLSIYSCCFFYWFATWHYACTCPFQWQVLWKMDSISLNRKSAQESHKLP